MCLIWEGGGRGRCGQGSGYRREEGIGGEEGEGGAGREVVIEGKRGLVGRRERSYIGGVGRKVGYRREEVIGRGGGMRGAVRGRQG